MIGNLTRTVGSKTAVRLGRRVRTAARTYWGAGESLAWMMSPRLMVPFEAS